MSTPTARYCGSNPERQSVGLPGHCERCAKVGHVRAHPDLGCGDVGCTAAHGPTEERAARRAEGVTAARRWTFAGHTPPGSMSRPPVAESILLTATGGQRVAAGETGTVRYDFRTTAGAHAFAELMAGRGYHAGAPEIIGEHGGTLTVRLLVSDPVR